MQEYYYIVFCILSTILGACFGSFATVLISRIPKGESIVKGQSHCPKCLAPIRAIDNIPIISYVILGGKCRDCKTRISPRYIIVELLVSISWLLCALLSKNVGYAMSILNMAFTFCLIVVAFIDLENLYIPDRFNITLLVIAIISIFLNNGILWWEHLLGLLFSMVFFGGTYFISKLVLKREGLGFGDVKLTVVCGLYLGFKSTFVASLIATIVGAVVLSVISISQNKKQAGLENEPNQSDNELDDGTCESADTKYKEYPFAPFLSLGFLVAVFVGELLVNLYLGLF